MKFIFAGHVSDFYHSQIFGTLIQLDHKKKRLESS